MTMVRSGASNNNNKAFQPFRNATTETPLCHMILEPTCLTSLQPLLVQLYRCRWFLSQPLRINLIPKWIMMKGVYRCSPITIGEILLVLPIVVFGIQGYHYSFVSPNTDASGYFASYVIFLAFATANKANSVFSLVFGIPFERMIPFHNLASLVSLVLTAFHTYTSFRFTDDSEFANVNILIFLVDGWTNQSGFIATLGMTILVLSSGLRIVRKFAYQLWLLLHITAAVAVLVGLILHKVETTIAIALWWALDLVARYAVQAGCTNRTKCKLKLIDRDAESHEPSVEISIDKPSLQYSAGQFLRIAIPAISVLEFHPFSISSAPHEKQMTLHIRSLGDWTAKLVQLAATTATTTVLIEGPYGAPSIDYDNDRHYQWFLLIGGGIGITPCQSIGKNILHQAKHEGRTVHGLQYVWAVRNMTLVEDIPPLGLTERSDIAEVDIYCTRCTSEDAVDSSVLPFNVHMGKRPDLNAVFTDMKAKASKLGESSVAVIACGPTKLMHDVEKLCRQHSPTVVGCGGDGVYFDLHKEHFEF